MPRNISEAICASFFGFLRDTSKVSDLGEVVGNSLLYINSFFTRSGLCFPGSPLVTIPLLPKLRTNFTNFGTSPGVTTGSVHGRVGVLPAPTAVVGILADDSQYRLSLAETHLFEIGARSWRKAAGILSGGHGGPPMEFRSETPPTRIGVRKAVGGTD